MAQLKSKYNFINFDVTTKNEPFLYNFIELKNHKLYFKTKNKLFFHFNQINKAKIGFYQEKSKKNNNYDFKIIRKKKSPFEQTIETYKTSLNANFNQQKLLLSTFWKYSKLKNLNFHKPTLIPRNLEKFSFFGISLQHEIKKFGINQRIKFGFTSSNSKTDILFKHSYHQYLKINKFINFQLHFGNIWAPNGVPFLERYLTFGDHQKDNIKYFTPINSLSPTGISKYITSNLNLCYPFKKSQIFLYSQFGFGGNTSIISPKDRNYFISFLSTGIGFDYKFNSFIIRIKSRYYLFNNSNQKPSWFSINLKKK